MSIISPFYKLLEAAILGAPVPIEVVAIGHAKDPVPDVIVANEVGYVFAPASAVADKVVVALLVLFSQEYNLLERWRTSDAKWRESAGIPVQFKTFIEAYHTSYPPQLVHLPRLEPPPS